MPKVFHFSELLNITFAPLPSKLSSLISRYQEWVMGALIFIIIILSTWGLYSIWLIAIACAIYGVYFFLLSNDHIKGIPLLKDGKSFHLIRVFLSCLLVTIGLIVFPQAREPLWLLFMFPFWRLLEKNSGVLWGMIILVFIISLIGIYCQQSLRTFNIIVFSPSVLLETALKGLWLCVIISILYVYTEFVNRTKKAENTRLDLILSLGKKLFQADNLESWCHIVLEQVLTLVGGNYATFQVCNRQLGELTTIAGIKKEDNSLIYLDPLNLGTIINIKYTEEEYIGLTGFVAKEGNAIAVSDVTKDSRYVQAFEDTYTEIDVPIRDLIHDWVGGIINVEYIEQESPKSQLELINLKDTLSELAELLAPGFSYVVLSDLNNKLREAGLHISSFDKEEDIEIAAIDVLYRQYGCPVAIWLVEPELGARLWLTRSRGLPKEYINSKPSMPIYQSILGQILIQKERVAQKELDSSYDHWNAISIMKPLPDSVIHIPLVSADVGIGVIQLFILRDLTFLKSELDMLGDLGRHVGVAIGTIRRRYVEKDLGEELANEMMLTAHELGNIVDIINPLIAKLIETCKKINIGYVEDIHLLESEINYLLELKDLIDFQSATVLESMLPKGFIDYYEISDMIEKAKVPLLVRGAIKENDIGTFTISPGAEKAFCSRVAVVLTIRNLLKNAIEAGAKDGKIIISASLSPDEKYVYIDVRNFGRVMTKEEQERLFESHYSTKLGGHGLGLITSRRLLERSNGKLAFQMSSKLTGTKFRIILKRRE